MKKDLAAVLVFALASCAAGATSRYAERREPSAALRFYHRRLAASAQRHPAVRLWERVLATRGLQGQGDGAEGRRQATELRAELLRADAQGRWRYSREALAALPLMAALDGLAAPQLLLQVARAPATQWGPWEGWGPAPPEGTPRALALRCLGNTPELEGPELRRDLRSLLLREEDLEALWSLRWLEARLLVSGDAEAPVFVREWSARRLAQLRAPRPGWAASPRLPEWEQWTLRRFGLAQAPFSTRSEGLALLDSRHAERLNLRRSDAQTAAALRELHWSRYLLAHPARGLRGPLYEALQPPREPLPEASLLGPEAPGWPEEAEPSREALRAELSALLGEVRTRQQFLLREELLRDWSTPAEDLAWLESLSPADALQPARLARLYAAARREEGPLRRRYVLALLRLWPAPTPRHTAKWVVVLRCDPGEPAAALRRALAEALALRASEVSSLPEGRSWAEDLLASVQEQSLTDEFRDRCRQQPLSEASRQSLEEALVAVWLGSAEGRARARSTAQRWLRRSQYELVTPGLASLGLFANLERRLHALAFLAPAAGLEAEARRLFASLRNPASTPLLEHVAEGAWHRGALAYVSLELLRDAALASRGLR